MADGFARIYGVELLYDTLPQIDKQELLAQLRKRCGRVDPLDRNEESGLLAFIFADHTMAHRDGSVPVQALIIPAEAALDPAALEPALQQSWDWPDARKVASRCRSSILVSDFLASGLDYKVRLPLFHGVVSSTLAVAPCLALHWKPAQRVVDSEAYLDARRQVGRGPHYPTVNVRLFRILHRAEGETVMDTMGLAALGLPDLQCHFKGLDPKEVARLLYNSAYYVFDHGDVIQDGHTIEGLLPGQRWRCHHEMALVDPKRAVIDLNPGPPYEAGNRRGPQAT